jgi:hypothetical protein
MSPSQDDPSRVSLAARFRQLLDNVRRVVHARTLGAELLLCGGCGQKLRVPIMSRTIRVTCPRCRRQTVVAPKTYPGAESAEWNNTTISAKRALAYLGGAVSVLFVIIWIFVGISNGFRGKDPNKKPLGVEDAQLRRNHEGSYYLTESGLPEKARNAVAPLRERGAPVNAESVPAEIGRAKSQAQWDGNSPAADLAATTIPINNQIIFDAYPNSTTRGQLTVSNGTDHHAIAKLIDIDTDSKVLSFAIGARQQSTIYRIADGTYQLIFAFGDRVYAGTDRFESPSGFFKFDNSLSFATTYTADTVYYYKNYTKLSVTLHTVLGGNAKTSSISRSDFERY